MRLIALVSTFALLTCAFSQSPTRSPSQVRKNQALIEAIQAGKSQVVERLLTQGADPNADTAKQTRPAITAKTGSIDVEIGGWSALMWAASGGHEDIVKVLLEHKARVNTRDQYGKTALTIAAFNGQTGIVGMLLDKGADIEAKEKITGGETALVMAAHSGYDDTVRLLLEHKANPNAFGDYHQTALIWAIVGNHKETCRLLLEHGADPNMPDDKGQKPLKYAKKNAQMVALLKKFGAKD